MINRNVQILLNDLNSRRSKEPAIPEDAPKLQNKETASKWLKKEYALKGEEAESARLGLLDVKKAEPPSDGGLLQPKSAES